MIIEQKRSVLVQACVIAGALCAVSCAVGQRYSYRDQPVQIRAGQSLRVVVATHDERPYVVSGKKPASFVGLLRGGYGNPFDVRTESGAPLADEFSRMIAESLGASAAEVRVVSVLPRRSRDDAIAAASEPAADRRVLLVLHEWKTDTAVRTRLLYDVELLVLGPAGQVLVQRDLADDRDLGGSFWSPPGHAKDAVPAAFRDAIQRWFEDSQVSEALSVR